VRRDVAQERGCELGIQHRELALPPNEGGIPDAQQRVGRDDHA